MPQLDADERRLSRARPEVPGRARSGCWANTCGSSCRRWRPRTTSARTASPAIRFRPGRRWAGEHEGVPRQGERGRRHLHVAEHRGALVMSLPLIAFVVFFVRPVVGPLTEMNASLPRSPRAEGDLHPAPSGGGRDEIGQTATTFNAMLATIAQPVRQVESARQVTGSARQPCPARRCGSPTARGARTEHSGQAPRPSTERRGGIASTSPRAERVAWRSQEACAAPARAQTLVPGCRGGSGGSAVRQMADSVEHFVESSTSITTMTRRRFARSPSRPICWCSTRPSRRPAPASRAAVLPWWPTEVRKLGRKIGPPLGG